MSAAFGNHKGVLPRLLCALCFGFALWGGLGSAASAATLYLSPQSGAYLVNQEISVVAYVTSSDQAMNAVSAVLSFSPTELEVVSLSKAGSIVGLWVQEPTFSNSVGSVNLEGIVLNPGFKGVGGKVLTIVFKTRAAGSAQVSVTSASILANDGQGTNILSTVEGASFRLNSYASGAPSPSPVPEPAQSSVIVSLTHPHKDRWYSDRNPSFSWELPAGTTAVRTGYGASRTIEPTVLYEPAIAGKTLSNVGDGVWYFALQMRTAQGWGPVHRFGFKIDMVPPEPFNIRFVDGSETHNPRPVALFDTIDALSGIDFYKVKVGEADFKSIDAEVVDSNPYTLGPYPPGTHLVLVQAFDRAGNYASASADLAILPLDTPVITDYPRDPLRISDFFLIKGTTYPDALVTVWLQRGSEEPEFSVVSSDQSGNFMFVADGHLEEGAYRFWASVTDRRGAQSFPTVKYAVVVGRGQLVRFGAFVLDALTVIAGMGVLLVAIGAAGFYVGSRVVMFRKRMHREAAEAEEGVHRAFAFLKRAMRDQIKGLGAAKTKAKLASDEKKTIERLEGNLEQAERFLEKEVSDIEHPSASKRKRAP